MKQTKRPTDRHRGSLHSRGPLPVTLDPRAGRDRGRYGQIEHHDGALLVVDSQAVRKWPLSSRSGSSRPDRG